MPAKASNRARELTTTTGTGTLSLSGAIDALHTDLLTNVTSGSLVPYCIEHQSADEWEVGWGVATSGTPDTLTRVSACVEESSNANALVSLSSGDKHVWIGHPASQFTELPGLCEGRLSLTTGLAVTTSDVTGASADDIFFVPYKGCGISLYNDTRWKRYTFSQITIAVPTSNYFRMYDVYVYDSSGTLTLELTAWDSGGQTTGTITGATNATPVVLTATNSLSVGDLIGVRSVGGTTVCNDKVWRVSAVSGTTITLEGSVGNGAYTSGGTWYKIPTARTTALAITDGVPLKTGALTRRYLGTFMTGATSGQTEDSVTRRLLWNYNNRVQRELECYDATDSWNYTTNTPRFANASSVIGTSHVWLVRGVSEDLLIANNLASNLNGSGANGAPGVGINTSVVNSARIAWAYAPGAALPTHLAMYRGRPTAGFVMVCRTEQSQANGTTSWYGDNGGNGGSQTGMVVEFLA